MEEKIFIQVRFKDKTSHGEYNDALYFTQEEHAKTEQKEIDKLKQERVDNWVYLLEHPTPYVEPTEEELTKYKEELQRQIDEVTAQIEAKKK